MSFTLLLTAATILLAVYYKLLLLNLYWRRRSVECASPMPIFGNVFNFITRQLHLTELLDTIYKQFPDERYIGFYSFIEPVLLVKDPDLINTIMVKKFDHFTDHQDLSKHDLMWNSTLFGQKGSQWKHSRHRLNPGFSSNKFKSMFPLMDNAVKQLITYLDQSEISGKPMEIKELFSICTNDLIAACVFGVEINTFQDRENEFYQKGVDIAQFANLSKLTLAVISSTLLKFFKVSIFSKSSTAFFTNVVKDNIKVRDEQDISRPDMIHFLNELRLNNNDSNNPVTIEDITAQTMLFYVGGFETSATIMAYTAYYLAEHPEVQEKLIGEIDEILKKNNGNYEYSDLLNMSYLDMVIFETNRLHPVTSIVSRMCTKSFTIEPRKDNEQPLLIKKGTPIWIPIYSIQRDESNYKRSNDFIPERFSVENKSALKSCTFLTYGIGPRNCLGYRFAMLLQRVIFFQLLSKYKFKKNENQGDILLSLDNVNMMPKDGIWLNLERRKTTYYRK